MPHSYGYRARTRHLFAKDFRKHGMPTPNSYLRVFKIGQIVDIKGDGSVHKGMPHKFYHGRTGVVWNVTKRAVGVEVNKLVGNRIMKKRIHVRVEHCKASNSRQGFLNRVKQNEAARKEAVANGTKAVLKRMPVPPRPGMFVKKPTVETIQPQVYGGIRT